MESLKFLNIIPYTLLNPITVVAYLGISQHLARMGVRVSTAISPAIASNTTRYHLPSYLIIAPLLTALFILLKVMTLTALANNNINIIDLIFVQPTLVWWILYGVTFVVLKVCFSPKGIEGNIMGFIFFPPLLIGSFILVVMHLHWIWTEVF